MIKATVRGQALKVETPIIASDTLNYLTAQFTFETHDWDGLIVVAHLSNGSESAEIELTNGMIRPEDGMNLTAGMWTLSLTGHEMVGGEEVQRITTVREYIRVVPSGVEDGEPLPDLPSYGESILAEVADIRETLGAFTAEAETLAPGSSAGASYDPTTGVFSFGIPRGDKGDRGDDGADGQDGFSPAATVEKVGNASIITITDKDGTTTATVTDGEDGADGYTPRKGVDYFDGAPGQDGRDGVDGYTPVKGVDYFDGENGVDGDDGASAYEIAVAHGFVGSEAEWLLSLKGATGPKGDTGAVPDFTVGTVTTGAAGTPASATITGTAEEPVLNLTIPKGDPGEVTQAEFDALADTVAQKADAIHETASGAVASFTDGAVGAPVDSLVVGIEPVQDLHGYDSPWPAGGGKNKLPNILTQDSANRVVFGSTDSLSDAEYTLFFTAGKYTLTFKRTDEKAYAVYYRGQIDRENIALATSSSTATVFTFDLPADDHYVFWIYKSSESGGVSPSDISEFQIEAGSTATTYTPYSNICPITGWTGANIVVSPTLDAEDGTAYNITFPSEAGTVYGGTLDVTTGVLTVNWKMQMASSLNWGTTTNAGARFYCLSYGFIKSEPYREMLMCSAYKPVISQYLNPPPDKTITNAYARGNNINVRDDSITSLADWNTYIAEHDFQILMGMEPVTYQLTPQEVTTLLGQNNVWADTGDVAVGYTADTKLYIDKKLGELVAQIVNA